VFLGSPAEVDAVFGARFVSLIETTANDVHFKLQLPSSLRMNVFYGEESSTVKEDVQAIHYFAGTSQLFLSDLMSRSPELRSTDSLMLSVEYEHPETGAKQFEDFAFNLGEISRGGTLVKKGRLVMSFIDGLADTVRILASPHGVDRLPAATSATGLTEATLRAAWEGEQKQDMARLIEALKAALPAARFEIVGERATLAYGAGGTIELVREHAAWKVEELK